MPAAFRIGPLTVTVRDFFRTSFVRKVVGLCVLTSGAALVLALAVTQFYSWRGQERDLIFDQTELADQMLGLLSRPTPENLARAETLVAAGEHTSVVAYYPSKGAPVVFVSKEHPQPTPAPKGLAGPSVVDQLQGPQIYLPYVVDGRRVGELVLVADNWEVREDLLRNATVSALVVLAALLLSALLAAALALRTLRPLHVLNRAIERVRQTRQFGAQVTVSCEDEIGRLTENFNALLSDLEVYSESLEAAIIDSTAARDAAQEANKQKTQFLANMSHEIRTPLNGVLGMAQVMSIHPLSPEQRERLEVIRKSGGILLAVLNDILDLSKIEAGKLDIESEPFDLAELVSGACASFTPAAENKGLSFALHLSDEARGWWRGDSVRVRQVLYNLISNAIKFTERGEVRVEIEADTAEGERLLLTVSDTGIGVSPEQRSRLFEKFSQADSSTTRRFGGTGLGLAICKQIVELMGGGMEMESELGRGTTFKVWLPLERLAQQQAQAQESHAAVDLSGLRVLAAEDNETNQLVLATILQALGVRPVIVPDGAAAVEAWRTGGFDLILMDIQMPGMDGVAATAAIRAEERERRLAPIRIIALSANAMRHQVNDYLAAGMDGHLAKPIVIERLHEVLAQSAVRVAAERAA